MVSWIAPFALVRKVQRDGMVVLITGSRDWPFPEMIKAELQKLPAGTTIIEGGAKGADRGARLAARELGMPVTTIMADWLAHGRAAGPIRNRKMLDMKPDLVLAFRMNMSRGTSDCIAEAFKRGIKVNVIDIERKSDDDKRIV